MYSVLHTGITHKEGGRAAYIDVEKSPWSIFVFLH